MLSLAAEMASVAVIAVSEILRRHPQVSIDLQLESRAINLVEWFKENPRWLSLKEEKR
ncbi:hypothetical protein [Rahnella ecdela]|uniref:hypothetical protein n=1 Tax=Rahnella ecdela TaxID=2816250 RepID=UPI001EE626CB|nr:hypothetical protein [Rahnella ecdela]